MYKNLVEYENIQFSLSNCPWRESCASLKDGECRNGCADYYTMRYLVENSLLPEQYKLPLKFALPEDGSLDRLEEIRENMMAFVKSGKSLILWGKTCGAGKTHYATRLLLRYFYERLPYAQGKPRGLFVDVPRLLNEFYSSEYVEFVRANIETDLVIWDDMFAVEMSQKQLDFLFSLLNIRVNAGLANVYTTNYSDEEIFAMVSAKMYSRINNKAEWVEFKGCDFRTVGSVKKSVVEEVVEEFVVNRVGIEGNEDKE